MRPGHYGSRQRPRHQIKVNLRGVGGHQLGRNLGENYVAKLCVDDVQSASLIVHVFLFHGEVHIDQPHVYRVADCDYAAASWPSWASRR
jgi:hypothetical protein